MKEEFKKIIASSRHLFSKLSYEKSAIRPDRDWQYITLSFLVGLIILGMGAVYIYLNVETNGFWNATSSSESSPIRTINQKNLDAVTGYFAEKEKNFQDAQNNLKIPPDPSL